jgi:predicted transcriptional regulator
MSYTIISLDKNNKIALTPIQLRIFEELVSGQMVSRKDLVKRLNTARTTIYDNLAKLQNIKIDGAHLIMHFSKYDDTRTRGRPIVYWYIPRIVLQKIRREKW